MALHRWSSLIRGYDLTLGYNQLILLLSAIGGAAVMVSQVLARQNAALSIWQAFAAGAIVFLAAALAKEMDPDHPLSAVLAAALAIPLLWVAWPGSVLAVLWLLLAIRFINRSTGLRPRVTDAVALLLLAGWLSWTTSPLFAVLTGGVLFIDGLLPDGRRAHLPAGAVVIAVGLAYWALNFTRFPSTPAETWLIVLLLAVTIAAFGVILACYVILATGDATGRPLDPSRVQSGQVVALGAGLSLVSWHGQTGVALLLAFWAALLGTLIVHWLRAAARRSTIPL